MSETCPVHDRKLERVADNKFRCSAGHDVHEIAVNHQELFKELRDDDDQALSAFADTLIEYEGGG